MTAIKCNDSSFVLLMNRFLWAKGDNIFLLGANRIQFDAYRAIAGSKGISYIRALTSYLHSGYHVMTGLHDSSETGEFPGREEIRVSLNLLCAIYNEWVGRDKPSLRSEDWDEDSVIPYYVHYTEDVNRFVGSIVQGYASVYESVIRSRESGQLNRRQQKLIPILGTLLQTSFSACNYQQHSALRNPALFFKESMERWGFAWFPSFIMNWEQGSIQEDVREHFEELDVTVQKHFKKHKREHRHVHDFLSDVDMVTEELIRRTEGKSEEQFDAKAVLLCQWLAVTIIKKYHQEAWSGMYKGRIQFKAKSDLIEERRNTEDHDDDVDTSERRIRAQGCVPFTLIC